MSISASVLAKFVRPVFVETGTCGGVAVWTAMEVGYKSVYSCDIDKRRIISAANGAARRGYTTVHVECSQSPIFLASVLPKIHEPITFWLDAHPAGRDLNPATCPVWDELDVIRKHCKVPYVLLIDDISHFPDEHKASLIGKVKEIAPGYKVYAISGVDHFKGDVLLAAKPEDIPGELELIAPL